MNETTKTYTRRDSATAVLRKMGVDKSHYNELITTNSDGTFTVDTAKALGAKMGETMAKADATAKDAPKAEPSTKDAPKAEPSTKDAPKRRGPRGGVGPRCKELILEGHTNKEVWEIVRVEFDMDENKRHYPGWYRCQMKRNGELSE